MEKPLSKRKLESYKKAELLARELRFQMAHRDNDDRSLLLDFVIQWMRSTGNIKYERPSRPKL
ncbi:MAG: hypothetical protein GY928_34655 [Colwellia sp.]|nr:hypothetical protein [Colwellia sp.]